MKIKVNDVLLFELTDHHKQVICNDIDMNNLDADMKRRLQYILMHKYEQCMKRFRQEWEHKIKEEGVASIPTDDVVFVDMIRIRPDYKDRAQREAEKQV